MATLDSETIHRLNAANEALSVFADGTCIMRRKGGWYIEWNRSNGESMSRRWATRNGSHFPVWYRHWGHGGTCTTALHQLVRWVRGQPVVPISSWHYWCGDRVYLARHRGAEVCSRLSDAGWPHKVQCVLCGVEIDNARDWWDLDGVSGPCCRFGGCRGCNVSADTICGPNEEPQP